MHCQVNAESLATTGFAGPDVMRLLRRLYLAEAGETGAGRAKPGRPGSIRHTTSSLQATVYGGSR